MENNRGQSIFLSVVGIATLLVAIVGATFAYFSISVTGNENASSIRVTTATVGGVTYSGSGPDINVTNVYPGWTKTQTFTIENAATTDSGASVTYEMYLVTRTDAVNNNDTSKDLAAAAAAKGDFVWALDGTDSTSAGYQAAKDNQAMPSADGTTLLGTGTLTGPSASHSYDFTVLLKESSTDQNELQGKSYYGVIQIVIDDAQGKRTWDNTQNKWVPYPAD